MVAVTQAVKRTSQPRGGYIPPKIMEAVSIESLTKLNGMESENIHATTVGLAVDYLTRFMNGSQKNEAFKISLMGSHNAGEHDKAEDLLDKVVGLDDISITAACQLVGYDVCYRAGTAMFKGVDSIFPNKPTCENIKVMVERGVTFIKQYGPIVKDGFGFEGAYTRKITIGDGDFLTKTTIWDFKVSKSNPTNKHTLQLIIYYLMGKRTQHKEFEDVEKIGIFNPRLNMVYTLEVSKISSKIIEDIEKNVIGY
ncbi:hypothetical protein AwErysi_05850 [Erysipelotrichaceae bacterium]|nr:hypothetical protein AwErysi_05850 [Erysipelotrichaceae bacterium]